MCGLYGKFASYLRRVLCKTRLIFPRINGTNVLPESSPARILSYVLFGAFSDFSWLVAVLETDSSENAAATLFSLI